MRILTGFLMLIGLLAVGLVFVGCPNYFISGTVVIVEEFTFTAEHGFYFYRVDITDEEDWDDYKDDIGLVDAVGVELFITSEEPGDVTFSAYVDDYSGPGPEPVSIPGTATMIIDSITISPGFTHLTYAQSLGFLTGVERLKDLVEEGQFDYYGESTGSDGETFIVDSAKVIMTLSGGAGS